MIYGDIYADGHSNNSIFEFEDRVHQFNPTYTPRLLKQRFLECGVELNTPDLNLGRKVSFEIHSEARPIQKKSCLQVLVAMENPNINKLNSDLNYCRQFDLVFAWDMRLQVLPNVIPTMIPHHLNFNKFNEAHQRDIFSCLINANKAFRNGHGQDLYIERVKTIRWYEQNAPDKFALYGLGWEKEPPAFSFLDKFIRAKSRLKSRLLGVPAFPSYRGSIKDKLSILSRSRFSFCYENNKSLSNYITEKIFDSFVAGCVPVYWGADNILNYIDPRCFIDRRKFEDTYDVHEYLLSVSNEKYAEFQEHISNFLIGNNSKVFCSSRFVDLIIRSVCEKIGFDK